MTETKRVTQYTLAMSDSLLCAIAEGVPGCNQTNHPVFGGPC